MLEDIQVKLVTYLGHSKNLMNCFIIIGYKEENLIKYSPNIIENQENYDITILSIITSKSLTKEIDFDDLIKRTYPQKPGIIQVLKTGMKPNPISVIFSSCFNSTNQDNKQIKIFYSCYAYRFYEKYKDYSSSIEYYVPKAFVIISEYPYFATFDKICSNLYKINIEEKEKDKKKEQKNASRNNSIKSEYYVTDNIPIELFIHCLVNYIPSPINTKINLKLFENEDLIAIPKLNGYPYIDFDLYKVINIFQINDFIKIYILMFLELHLLFFSPDLTKLSIFMHSLYILNYPLTNSNFFSNLKTIQKNEMKKGFGAFKTFLGINTNYEKDMDFSNFEGNNFAIDIENKKPINKIYKNNESDEIEKLLEYLNNILNNNKKRIKSYFLLNSIDLLKAKLESIKNMYNKKSRYLSNSFFFINEKISEINILIQEAFYDFILSIINVLNYDYQIDKNCSSLEKTKEDYKIKDLSEEEKIFIKYCRLTDKYNCYFEHFIKEFDTFDEFKIPLLFCNEFAHLKKNDIQHQISYKLSYFKIMDSFYSENSESIQINYNNLFNDFKKDKNKKCIEKVIKTINNQLFCLDKKIVNTFLYYKKNKKSAFNSLKEREKIELTIKSVEKSLITITIQNHFKEFLSKNYFIRSSIVYVFSIIFPIFSFNSCIFYLANILDNINKIEYFQRYYIYIVFKSIYKYYLVNKENFQFSELNLINIKGFCDIIKMHLNSNFILPFEELFLLLKKISNDNNNENRNIQNKANNNNNFVFKYDKVENYINKIKYDVVEKQDNLVYFKVHGKNIEYNSLSPDNIFKKILSLYNDYFDRYNVSI